MLHLSQIALIICQSKFLDYLLKVRQEEGFQNSNTDSHQ